MAVPCPYCHTPSDLPLELHARRELLSMSERVMFDLLWRRSPGLVTPQEIHDAFEHFGKKMADNSYQVNIFRMRKKFAGLDVQFVAVPARGWKLTSNTWDRSKMF